MREFQDILDSYGLTRFVTINKTDRTFRVGERMVEFFGADDQQKLRGYKADILYCNEANELNHDIEFLQLRLRTTGPIFLDFNPSSPYVWIKEELEDKRAIDRGDVQTIVSTYKDNPSLNDQQIAEIEYLEQSNPELWKVYGLGEYGKIEGLIYPNFRVVNTIPVEARRLACGLDFGFSNSATALVECAVIEPNKLYVNELMYDYGLTDTDIGQKMKNIDFPKSRLIAADSAQPGSIKEIRRFGYKVYPTKKLRNSVIFGINLVQRYEIQVTARSKNILRELKTYMYKQDKDSGDWYNEPEMGNDHALDAMRYYALNFLTTRRGKSNRR